MAGTRNNALHRLGAAYQAEIEHNAALRKDWREVLTDTKMALIGYQAQLRGCGFNDLIGSMQREIDAINAALQRSH
jgi:hypothetical protein